MFTIKKFPETKFKARLVARGFQQRDGIDYFNIHSPALHLTSLRILFAIAIHESQDIHHVDVPTAHLNGNLDVTLYMKPPEGTSFSEDEVLELQKSLLYMG